MRTRSGSTTILTRCPTSVTRFRDALAKSYPHAAAGVRVALHPGTGHMESAQKPALFQNCLAWLAEDHTHH